MSPNIMQGMALLLALLSPEKKRGRKFRCVKSSPPPDIGCPPS